MKTIVKIIASVSFASVASSAMADVTCTADAGSEGGPYYTVTAPTHDEAYNKAYDEALTFVNISNRNPIWITVSCND